MNFDSDLRKALPGIDPENGDVLEVVPAGRLFDIIPSIVGYETVMTSFVRHNDRGETIEAWDTHSDQFLARIVPHDKDIACVYRRKNDGTPFNVMLIERLASDTAMWRLRFGALATTPTVRRALWDLGIRRLVAETPVVRPAEGVAHSCVPEDQYRALGYSSELNEDGTAYRVTQPMTERP